MTERKRTTRIKAEQELVSFRLPADLLARVDAAAEQEGSNRTYFIRRALATYFRLGQAILVPLSAAERTQLVRLGQERHLAPEQLASELLREQLRQELTLGQQTLKLDFAPEPRTTPKSSIPAVLWNRNN